MQVPIEISARHIHLCPKDLEILFGKGYCLKKKKDLTQPGEFAAQETLDIKKGNKVIKNVRIVGPLRFKTQVELSATDFFALGLKVLIKKSGDIDGTPGVILSGPKGKLKLKRGVIVPWRHIHIGKREAERKNLKNGQIVSVKVKGIRSVIFNNVKIRTGDSYKLCFHLDTDEGNAANISTKGKGEII